jgi:hypothetical protein
VLKVVEKVHDVFDVVRVVLRDPLQYLDLVPRRRRVVRGTLHDLQRHVAFAFAVATGKRYVLKQREVERTRGREESYAQIVAKPNGRKVSPAELLDDFIPLLVNLACVSLHAHGVYYSSQ